METTGDIINQYLVSNNLKSLPSSSSGSFSVANYKYRDLIGDVFEPIENEKKRHEK